MSSPGVQLMTVDEAKTQLLITEAIAKYRRDGLSFIPVPYKSKIPKIEWKQYQEHRPSDIEISQWFNGCPSNIAVICGRVSGNLVVLDFDSLDRYEEFSRLICLRIGLTNILDYTRTSKTARGYHLWLRTKESVKSQKFPNLDIKGEGSYVIAPPSVHPSGAQYQFLNDKQIVMVDSLALIGIDTDQPSNQPGWVSQLLEQGAREGSRNDSAAKLAGYFRNSIPIDVTERIMLDWNIRNTPPLPENELRRTIASVYRLTEHPTNGYSNLYIGINERYNSSVDTKHYNNVTGNVTPECNECYNVSLSQRVQEWVKGTSGWWFVDELDKELDIRTEQDKNNRRLILHRLKEQGIIEQHLKLNKQFRYINTKVSHLDFKSASSEGVINLKWPLGIEKYVNLFPGNIACIAGSPNAGKTALMLNLIYLNQDRFPIYYFCSEMGNEELRARLENFEGMTIEDWKFEAIERAVDFEDVIRPDSVNIIDYLEMTDELWAVNTHLTAISHKLGSGIAIVAIQKKIGQKLGRGQEFALEKPKLYLSVDKGKMTIVKGKSWVNKRYDPNDSFCKFKIINGCQFEITQDWTKGD